MSVIVCVWHYDSHIVRSVETEGTQEDILV